MEWKELIQICMLKEINRNRTSDKRIDNFQNDRKKEAKSWIKIDS